jgi:hypothetical protein
VSRRAYLTVLAVSSLFTSFNLIGRVRRRWEWSMNEIGIALEVATFFAVWIQ